MKTLAATVLSAVSTAGLPRKFPFIEQILLVKVEFDNLTNSISNFDYGRKQVTKMNIIPLLLAIIGHIICGVTDCLLSYSKKGRLNLKDINDADKMSEMFKDMPLSFPLSSILFGTLAITMFSFGYFELCNWMSAFSKTASVIMFISAIIFLIPIVTHHVFCGAVEWMYIRLGRTNAAREAVLEFQKKTFPTMYVGYAGLLTFMITLFIMIVSGSTSLPMWACVFTTVNLPKGRTPKSSHNSILNSKRRLFGISDSRLLLA